SFEVFTCEGNAVLLTINDRNYDRYRIFYTAVDSVEVARGETPDPYLYPLGSHDAAVKGIISGGLDNCPVSVRSFATFNTLVAAGLTRAWLGQKSDQNGIVTLDYTLSPAIVYRLEHAPGFPAGFTPLEYLTGSRVSVDSLDTKNEVHNFRIAAFDACQDRYLYSDTLSTIALNVKVENAQNRIEWNSSPAGFSEYRLYRDNQPYRSFSNRNITYFIDNDVECFVNYCYTMSYSGTGGSLSFSDTVCVEATSIYFPPAIRNTTTSAEGRGISLTWDPPPGISIKEYFIQRKIDTDIYTTIDTTLAVLASDTTVDNSSASYCYRVSYLDQCNNRSNLGYESCSIHLLLEEGNRLTWNEYSGWRNGVKNYILEIYDENQVLRKQLDMGIQNGYLLEDFYKNQISSYRISAVSNDIGPYIAYSNYIFKTLSSVISVPNAFTPDGDGLNDLFNVSGTGMRQYKLRIFSKHGNLLFESIDQETGWDGSYLGNEVPEDTYIYNIIAEDFEGKEYRVKGALVLLRH
ncbi:MAG TPA: T9SS type B sorting domain-containing protein, partial [Cyclobacteriaceae bacterium]|nr:T9SS type B sorting domain-containing protein [Cyclobacteriaceae bacterium]